MNLKAAGVPEAHAQVLAGIMLPVRMGWTAAVTDSVLKLTGHEPRALQVFAVEMFADVAETSAGA
ncbi:MULTISPECIES: hypothetical protein [Rhizobium]|uniref:Uncharacterized protein n=1 Tax=Rhizobium paranaense TaxID=1650438 RepID=A0A7W9D4V4_9HYPH|nr:hypothetical protein [Rhizobium paranaense]MBB5577625.1 hypothetical protein [Rhizobium paranaense]